MCTDLYLITQFVSSNLIIKASCIFQGQSFALLPRFACVPVTCGTNIFVKNAILPFEGYHLMFHAGLVCVIAASNKVLLLHVLILLSIMNFLYCDGAGKTSSFV